MNYLIQADVSKERNIARIQKINAYPTIRLFYKNRQYEYSGGRSVNELKTFGLFKFLYSILSINTYVYKEKVININH